MRADWDDDLSILSSENVNFAVETAGLGTRFAAVLIDMTLQLLVLGLLSILALYFFAGVSNSSEWMRLLGSIGNALLGIIVFLVVYAYFFFFEWLMDGQTPGKRWLHLRVLQTTAMPITMWAALVRNVLRIIDFMPICYGVGALVAVWNPHNRRVGDLIAGTVVARERPHGARRLVLDIDEAAAAFLAAGEAISNASPTLQNGTMPTPALTVQAANAETLVSTPASTPVLAPATAMNAQVAAVRVRLDNQDYELIREFLLRRNSMKTPARLRLAQSLVVRLCQKLGEPLPPAEAVETFLENVAAMLQDA